LSERIVITFLDKFTGRTIGTSRKVMSSFFKLNPYRFEEIVSTGWCDFLLVRDPYTRFLSLVNDKCWTNVVPGKPQRCQRRMMEAFCFENVESLKRLTLYDFNKKWWSVMGTDEHFVPQVYGVSRERCGEIIQIENGLPLLGQKLDLDFSKKVNATQGEWGMAPTSDLHFIVKCYRQDFVAFGYKVWSPTKCLTP
jgi:hypothetical protein